PETRYKVLSFFFDGVQKPGEQPGAKKLKQPPAKKPVERKEPGVQATPAEQEAPAEPPRPPIEALKGWEEVLGALPKDFAGGADWVQAIREGVIAPRARVDSRASPEPPYTLDTIVQGLATNSKPPLDLDIEIVPSEEEAVEADLAKAKENPVPSSPEIVERGKAVYLRACAVCHGEEGDGRGPLADGLNPKPRDFTSGMFKFRSTPSSSLPTDFDIFRTITKGVLGTSMPAWSSLPYEDRWSLVHFIKTLSEDFEEEDPEEPIVIPDPPPPTAELVEQGRQIYMDVECNSCHGDEGGGDGPSASDLKDEWGDPIRPFNFMSGLSPKGGSAPRDVYRAVMTGLQGTPMPDFGEVFEDKKLAWAVVYHVLSLGEERRGIGFGVKGEVRFHRKAATGISLPRGSRIGSTGFDSDALPATPPCLR
ncbi:MAG: c-type cytochrome, partial [Nitrospinota bacterium]